MIEFKQHVFPPGLLFTLREQSPEDLAAAAAKLTKSDDSDMSVIDHQTDGIYDWYAILSKGKFYQVNRFGPFLRCTCKDFEFGQKACKHIALVVPPSCTGCGKPVPYHGAQCIKCHFQPKAAVKRAARTF